MYLNDNIDASSSFLKGVLVVSLNFIICLMICICTYTQ